MRGKLTSNFVVDVHQMEGLAADRTAVGLAGPFPETGVVQGVPTNVDDRYAVVVVDVVARCGDDRAGRSGAGDG